MLVSVDTIYVDSLFALNLAADYLMLLCGARISGAVIRRGRLFIAAVVGAAYAVACVLPKWGMLTSPIAKIALGVGMCLIAYGSERRFWRCCGCFFAVSALFGGAVWASGMLAGTDGAYSPYVPVSGRVLVLSFAICYAAVSLLFRRTLAKRSQRTVPLTVRLGDRSLTLRALIDTGNTLSDPASGRAVIVADARALSPLLGFTPDLSDVSALVEALSRVPGLERRVSLVPYCSVGVSGGLLAAFRPDTLELGGKSSSALLALGEVRGDDYEAIAPETTF